MTAVGKWAELWRTGNGPSAGEAIDLFAESCWSPGRGWHWEDEAARTFRFVGGRGCYLVRDDGGGEWVFYTFVPG